MCELLELAAQYHNTEVQRLEGVQSFIMVKVPHVIQNMAQDAKVFLHPKIVFNETTGTLEAVCDSSTESASMETRQRLESHQNKATTALINKFLRETLYVIYVRDKGYVTSADRCSISRLDAKMFLSVHCCLDHIYKVLGKKYDRDKVLNYFPWGASNGFEALNRYLLSVVDVQIAPIETPNPQIA